MDQLYSITAHARKTAPWGVKIILYLNLPNNQRLFLYMILIFLEHNASFLHQTNDCNA